MISFETRHIPWNDYGYYIHYDLFFIKDRTRIELGRVLIMDSTTTEMKENKAYYNNESLLRSFTSLPKIYVSVGHTSEYYSNIYKYSKDYPELKDAIRDQLHDIVLSQTVDEYSRSSFFMNSFSRNKSSYVMKNSYPRIVSTGKKKKEYCLKFSFDEFEGGLNFNTGESEHISNNVFAVIGNNGVGKTRLLQKVMTKVSEADFNELQYNFTGKDYGSINKMLLLTMSTFDNHKHTISDLKNGKYIGIIDYDSESDITFKSSEKLLAELYGYIKIIKSNHLMETELNTILEEQISCFDPYLREFINNKLLTYNFNGDQIENEASIFGFQTEMKTNFSKLSSGQTNMLYMVFSLIATVEEDMFVVIDEPELYLHPPYIMGYINLLNYIFDRRNAIAFIATHSPIIIQQLPSESVYEMKRYDEKIKITPIDFPCYGESISIITEKIFNVSLGISGFYKDLEAKTDEELSEIYTESNIGIEAKIFIKSRLRSGGK